MRRFGMAMKKRPFTVIAATVALVGMATAPGANAAVLCQKKSGAVFVRDPACKPKETVVTAASIGAVGPQGIQGLQGTQGIQGIQGIQGQPGASALAPLMSGQTVSGVWGASVTVATGGDGYRAYAEFPIPLAADIADTAHTIFVSGTSATHCAGEGNADPGYLCLYQGYNENVNPPSDGNIFNPTSAGAPGASRFGFAILLSGASPGLTSMSGTFAVTAP
jgi:hypothetical protein